MLKKKMMLAMVMTGVLIFGAACAPQPAPAPAPEPAPEAPALADGNYFAQGEFDANSGWKYMVTLEVADGKITAVDWNGANINAGTDKKTTSKDGNYPMVERGGAIAPWHEQAALVEAFLLEKQDPKAINLIDEDGHTDAVSGATIKVADFVKLTEEALAAGPVDKGPYKDGAYRAEAQEFAGSGWKETVDLTIVNGNIVAVNWNGVHKDGGDDKKTQSKDGRYGMKEKGNAVAEWHEQAALVEAFLLEKQDPAAITLKDADGHTDAVSGATLKVNGFTTLVAEALASAK